MKFVLHDASITFPVTVTDPDHDEKLRYRNRHLISYDTGNSKPSFCTPDAFSMLFEATTAKRRAQWKYGTKAFHGAVEMCELYYLSHQMKKNSNCR